MKKLFTGIFITLFLLAVSMDAWAAMVGAVMPTRHIPFYDTVHKTLEQELGALGTGAEVLLQKPSPDELAWKNATRKLVTLEAKVIVAYGSATTLAVLSESGAIPVVYVGAYDPAGSGLTGKATGMSGTVPLKGLIGNLKKISNFKKLGILYSPGEVDSVKQMDAAADLAGKLGAQAVKIDSSGMGDSIDLQGADAIFLTSAANINSKAKLPTIIETARGGKIATASVLSGSCELGVIISLSADPVDQGKGAAKMVADILNGGSPAANNTPKVEMTINLKEAKALGLNIPFELLGTAKVIK